MKALTVVLAVFSLFAIAVPGYAETVHLRGDIPFEFVAAGRAMPAGEYDLASSPAMPGIWVLSGPNSPAGLFLMLDGRASKSGDGQPRLVFVRYGDQLFLNQVWTSQRVLRVRYSSTERLLAGKPAPSGTVTIAMR